jgi:hypothetical protein
MTHAIAIDNDRDRRRRDPARTGVRRIRIVPPTARPAPSSVRDGAAIASRAASSAVTWACSRWRTTRATSSSPDRCAG